MTARYTDPLELVGTLLGKYRVQSLVGEGGFAVVYRAVDTTLDRTVALKVLTAHLDSRAQNPEVQARVYAAFRAEAKLVAQLSDRNIVQIFDWGETETPSGARAPWMALEWVEGQTLELELAARRGRGGRPLAEALGLLRPLVEAVAHAHEHQVVHRDLKPGNVMLARSGGLRLLDFGIAKAIEAGAIGGSGDTRTRTPPIGLSPAYAAPEQFQFSRTGPWTDVYALGLILTEVLTDQPPYDPNRSPYEEATATARPTPAKLGVDVGAAAERVLARAVAVAPSARQTDARELLRELEEAAKAGSAPEPVVAPKPAPEPRPVRRAGGVRTVAWVGAAVVASGVFALGWQRWGKASGSTTSPAGAVATDPPSLPGPASAAPQPTAHPTAAPRPRRPKRALSFSPVQHAIERMIGSWADGRTIVTLQPGDEFPHPMISFWELAEGAIEARGAHSAHANVDSLTTGDFDGDHMIDVAYTAFGEGGGVQVVTQRGEQQLPVTDPMRIVAADVDGDGRLDLVTLDFDIHDPQMKGAPPRREGAFLSIFLGNGDGSFHRELRTRLSTEPGEPWALAAGDVDGDGKLDLIVSFRSRSEPAAPGQTVGALVNLGQGRFAAPVTVFLGTEPEVVTAADLDGDGRADVVTANGDLDSVSVVLSQADGAHIKFGAPTTIRLPGEAHGVAVADLDDDGCPDLAIPDAHDRTHQVHVYAGDCRGGFVRAKSFKVAGEAYGVTASDLNGDGQPDLVVTTPVGLTVLVNTSQPRGSR